MQNLTEHPQKPLGDFPHISRTRSRHLANFSSMTFQFYKFRIHPNAQPYLSVNYEDDKIVTFHVTYVIEIHLLKLL